VLENIVPTSITFAQSDITGALQYGALGVLALVLVAILGGFFWYVRSIEARAARREEKQHERQEKYIEAIIKSTSTLAILISRMQSHDRQMQEEHKAIMNECFSRRGIGQ
jgi:uncharacterized protein HemX